MKSDLVIFDLARHTEGFCHESRKRDI